MSYSYHLIQSKWANQISDVLEMTAAEIARQIRAKSITVSETIEAHIQRNEKVNPLINAVITPMFEQAREQASEADQFIANNCTDNLATLIRCTCNDQRLLGSTGWFR